MGGYYNGSLSEALETVYPEYDWKVWQFQHFPVSYSYWNSLSNQRTLLDQVAQELQFTSPDNWYTIETSEIERKKGGRTILYNYYQGSLIRMLLAVYPENNWQLEKFKHMSKGFWSSEENIKSYLEWFAQHNNIREWKDWYDVYTKQLNQSLLHKYGGLMDCLKKIYPQENWHWSQRTVMNTLFDIIYSFIIVVIGL